VKFRDVVYDVTVSGSVSVSVLLLVVCPELIPRPATLYEDPPLYLCLKIGRPLNKAVSKTCPIESYTKRHKPEYWFSIPRDK